jgi:hypothetical protein
MFNFPSPTFADAFQPPSEHMSYLGPGFLVLSWDTEVMKQESTSLTLSEPLAVLRNTKACLILSVDAVILKYQTTRMLNKAIVIT